MGENNMSENRREFFRVEFDRFINGEIAIQEGALFPVKITNMSAGGMNFISAAQMLMHEKIECRFTILERTFLIKGFIVRKAIKVNYTEYGMEFKLDQETASALFKQLNYYQIRQRKGKR
jgi:hypothetical protein